MKKFTRIFLLPLVVFGTFATPASAAEGDGSPQDPNILYVGRWDKSNASAPHSYWGGAYVRTGFTGTSLSVKLGKSADIAVFIDDKAPVFKMGANGTVNLASGLASGNHTVKVVARFQADQLVFQGFVLAQGAKTLPAQKSKALIEFIGNSITSGSVTTNGNVSAFPWIVGETLGADRTAISYPGITLVNGYYLNFNGLPAIGMEVSYTKTNTPPMRPATTDPINIAWNFNQYTPDIVVINIGTNDGNGAGVPTNTFQTSYLNFLKFIRGKFPKAHIFALRTFGGYMATQTQNAATQLINAGDSRIHYVNTTNWLVRSDFASDGLHPSDDGQKKAANLIANILKPYVDSIASASTAVAARAEAQGSLGLHRTDRRLSLAFSVDGRNMNLEEIRARLDQLRTAPRN
jgi:hypothetical protein